MDNYNQSQNQPQNGYTNNTYSNNPNPYPADSFGQPQPPRQPVVIDSLANKKDRLPTTSLVVGVMGIVFCWIFALPFILGLIGLIMGIVSLSKTTEHSGVALAGTIVSGVAICLNIAFTLFYIFIV